MPRLLQFTLHQDLHFIQDVVTSGRQAQLSQPAASHNIQAALKALMQQGSK
jgi:hypothetical protein